EHERQLLVDAAQGRGHFHRHPRQPAQAAALHRRQRPALGLLLLIGQHARRLRPGQPFLGGGHAGRPRPPLLDAQRDHAACSAGRWNINAAQLPPKPKLLDSTLSMRHAWVCCTSGAVANSGSASITGAPAATKPCCIISTPAIASSAPAAPGAWPLSPLIDDIAGTGAPRSANTASIACHSCRSPCGVEQAWVLM